MWVTHRCEEPVCGAPSRVIMIEDGITPGTATTAELDQKTAAHNARWHPATAPFSTRLGRGMRALAWTLMIVGAAAFVFTLLLLVLAGPPPAAALGLGVSAVLISVGLRMISRGHDWRMYDRRKPG